MIEELFIEMFENIQKKTGYVSKNKIAKYLANQLMKYNIIGKSDRNLTRYFDKYIDGKEETINPKNELLDAISKELCYENYEDYVLKKRKKVEEDKSKENTGVIAINTKELSKTSLDYNSKEIYQKNSEVNNALQQWKEQVEKDIKWSPVQLILNHDLSNYSLYQPIYLSPLDRQARMMTYEAGEMREFQLSQSLYQESLMAISIHSLLTNASHWSILIGVPGSGKTSSMKWLLHQISSGKNTDYDNAIYISLFDLNEYLELHPNSSLYACFFYTYLGYEFNEAKSIAYLLQKRVEQKEIRILFLFDGLDEVPPERRRFIISHIHQALSHEKVIITSRPSASSALFSLAGFSFYDIIPLPPASIRNLVTKYCHISPNNLSANEVLQKISNSIALQKLAVTPFILIIICEIISYEIFSKDILHLNQATLFSKLVELIQLENNQLTKKYILEEKHIQALKDFAEKLSFLSDKKVIKGSLPTINDHIKGGLAQSRFINEVGLNLGVFEFVHLRLQEYFTALSLYKKEIKEINRFVTEKAFNPEWIEVTCFLFGHAKGTAIEQVLNDALKKQLNWIQHEQTGNGWYRLAKMQIAKGQSLREENDLGINLYQILLDLILKIHPLYISFIELLLESEGIHFIKDLNSYQPLVQIWSGVYRLAPISIRKTSGLLSLVQKTPELAYIKAMRGSGFLDEVELIKYRKVLKNWKNEELKDLSYAINQVGIASDLLSMDLLKQILATNSTVIFRKVAYALSHLGGNKAACILANALINVERNYSEKNMRALADSLSLRRNKAIEPQSKSILCNWLLKQKAPYPENMSHVMFALMEVTLNVQIGEKLIDMILSNSLDSKLRVEISILISGIQDDENLTKLLKETLSEEKKVPLSIIGSIPFIPVKNKDLIDLLLKKMTTFNDRSKLSCLELFLKSYNKYPKHPNFSFVPELLNKEFLLSDHKQDQYRYRIYLWQMMLSFHINNHFIKLAWRDLLNQKVSLALKGSALNYLDSLYFSLDNNQVERLKQQLIEDQKQSALRDYVKGILGYLLLRSSNSGEELISFIEEYFDPENRNIFIKSIIKEAALSGQLIIGENLPKILLDT